MKTNTATNDAAREIIVSRLINFPRELVWEAMTDPQHLPHWWGPDGFTNTVHEISVKPGGVWRYMMHGPDGTDYPNRIVYRELVRPERIEYDHFGEGEWAHHIFHQRITLEAEGHATRVTLCLTFAGQQDYENSKVGGAIEGGTQTLGRLDDYAATLADPHSRPLSAQFCIDRIVDAPRELVWKAYTEADRLAQWWGPKGFTMLDCRVDLRPGGLFHYGMRSPDGFEMWGKFVFREIAPPGKLVYVVSFSDKQGGTTRHFAAPTWPKDVLNILTLTEAVGKTKIVMRGYPVNATEEERQMFTAGFESMKTGFGGTLGQLEAYLDLAKGQ